MTKLSVQAINALDPDSFTSKFADVAENSPWVAQAAFVFAPFASRTALIEAFANALFEASEEAQLALIRAHPDLAGKAARSGEMAEASKAEQAGAGLNQLTEAEFARFTQLNEQYRAKFGFPFIFAVKGATKHQILEGFEARLPNSRPEEFAEALRQITRIFRFRLEVMVELEADESKSCDLT